MNRARDPIREGDIQQGIGRVLLRDGHDRGTSSIGYSRRVLANCHLASPQAFTDAVPFNNSLPAAAMLAIMAGKRPQRPTHRGFTDHLWALTQHCWDQDPRSRPEISEVLKVLRGRTIEQQHLLVGYSPKVSHPPSPHNVVASSSRHAPQIAPQNSRSYTGSQTAFQDPSSGGGYYRPSKEQGGQSGGHVSRRSSRRGKAGSEPPPIDPGPFDLIEPQNGQVYGYAGEPGMSRTNTLGDRNRPRKDTRGKGSRELSNRALIFTAAETRVGPDPNYDVDDDDEGVYWLGAR